MNQVTLGILCGRSSASLWPLSRVGFPKQLIVLSGDGSGQSLFQQAIARLNSIGGSNIELNPTLIAANEDHLFLALDQLRELKGMKATLLLESSGRNTAPALIRRFHEAKIVSAPEVIIWGAGTPRRGLLYVDDMAAASVSVKDLDKAIYDQHTQPMQSHINVGLGSDVTIAELATEVAKATRYQGRIGFDSSKPEGAPRKWMDSSRLSQLGWTAKNSLSNGLQLSYADFTQSNLSA